jgi:D-3-phosphoglycerate dehydrogenase
VLLFEEIHPAAMTWLRGRAEVRLPSDLKEEALLPLVAAVDGIVIRANGGITERLLSHAPRLRVVGRHGVGLDNVDVAACTRRGIWVVHTPLANVEAVAEHTVGLMLAVARRIVAADAAVRAGEFAAARLRLIGEELHGKTLGVVGFGRIGQRVGEICRAAFAMPLLYADVVEQAVAAARLGAERVPLDDLLARSDVVSLHAPLTETTRGLIDAAALARMRPGAILINTARGALVEEAALVAALRSGRLSAGLDVFAGEPLSRDAPLAQLPNVVLTPHNASHTEAALRAMAAVVEDIMRVLQGERPRFPANEPRPAR